MIAVRKLWRYKPSISFVRCINLPPTVIKKIDRFNGLHLDAKNCSRFDAHHVITTVKEIVHNEKKNFKAIWVTLTAFQGDIISTLCEPLPNGPALMFHHASGSEATLFRWLGEGESRLPEYASHQVGVAGVLLKPDCSEVLMVREKNGATFTGWKFPTGLIQPGEDIDAAVVREVYEECSIKTKFCGVISFRQQHNHPNAFGCSDLLFICRLELIDNSQKSIIKICPQELSDCRWISLSKLQKARVHCTLNSFKENLSNQANDPIDITLLTSKIIHSITTQSSIKFNEFSLFKYPALTSNQLYNLYLPTFITK